MQKNTITQGRLAQLLSDKVQNRFWEKVKKRNPNECWHWTAGKSGNGYGVFHVTFNGKSIQFSTHRLAWVSKHKKVVPSGKMILHSCKLSRHCCNPKHLRPGDQVDNMRDARIHGTSPIVPGEGHCHAKLKNHHVIEIRKLCAKGATQRSVAEKFGIHFTHVNQIVLRRIWKHI
jgi:hypothetical protein